MMTLKIGLIGFGTVGTGIYERLTRSRKEIEAVTGKRFTIEAILIKDEMKERTCSNEQFVSSWQEFKQFGPYDVVFEAMNGVELAKTYTSDLLRAGTAVITANKKLVATHGPVLEKTAIEAGVYYGWDAAVCGVIPVVNSLKSVFLTTDVHAITGILNGTTNYILTKMATGQTYENSLQEARELGYAEEDPTDDVEGWDAVYKTCLLAKSCFNQWLDVIDVKRVGINYIEAWHASGAKEFGWSIKLVGALVQQANGSIKGSVEPTVVLNDHILSTIDGVMNGVCLDGIDIDQLLIAGAGAGKAPTANSAVEDFVFHERNQLFKRQSPSCKEKKTTEELRRTELWFIKENQLSQALSYLEKTKIWNKRTVKEGMIFHVDAINEEKPFPAYPCLSKELERAVSQAKPLLTI